MPTQNEIEDALLDAKLAVLQQIKQEAYAQHASSALHLAEAYAWLTSTHQSHGAGFMRAG